ncbi:hypothetical protein LJB81_01550 [Desulfovibrio sp. OttesenSCG-928-M14]|nr:hypothetical protein [Desulfovibrio sp. OttesenSCG-928-M14]
MHTILVRKSGGSLIMTIPQAYTEQNQIVAGEELAVEITGEKLTIKPARPKKYSLDELLAETPKNLNRVEGWLEMKPVGREAWADDTK